MGVPVEQLRELYRRQDQASAADNLGIVHEAWPAWQLFLDLSTQWRYVENEPRGLDYTAALAALKVLGYKRKRRLELWRYLQNIELGALGAYRGIPLDRLVGGDGQ